MQYGVVVIVFVLLSGIIESTPLSAGEECVEQDGHCHDPCQPGWVRCPSNEKCIQGHDDLLCLRDLQTQLYILGWELSDSTCEKALNSSSAFIRNLLNPVKSLCQKRTFLRMITATGGPVLIEPYQALFHPHCPGTPRYSRSLCEDLSWNHVETFKNAANQDLETNRLCQGSRPSQRIDLRNLCDGVFHCIDRSDESHCDLNVDLEAKRTASAHHDCKAYEVACGESCLLSEEFCVSGLLCGQTEKTKFDFCHNVTFWSGVKCHRPSGEEGVRCTGNHPYQCMYPSLRYKLSSGQGYLDVCNDKSNRVFPTRDLKCSGERVISEGFHFADNLSMWMCKDNKTCVHDSLVCDGNNHCQDASDEEDEMCKVCPRKSGYPEKGRRDATYSCR